jgi:molybdopterin-binding protein
MALATAGLVTMAGSAVAQSTQPGVPLKPSATPAAQSGGSRDVMKQGKRVVVGKVVDMRDINMKGGDSSKHHIVILESTKGKRVMVDTGLADKPVKDLKLSKGDRVVAIGKSARINGKPVLFAQSIGELQPAGSVRK